MRKFFITTLLFISLLGGIFVPVSFSVEKINSQKIFALSVNTPVQITQQKAFASDPNQSSGASSEDATECGKADIFCMMYKLIITFILYIPNAILTLTGLLMDFSLKYSINPAMYGFSGDLVETGLRTAWTVVRDFANLGFIFALFVAAFGLILNNDIAGFKPKQTVVRVIIMALLVNFSFVFCRLIIQTADVFSNFMYQRIESERSRTDDLGIEGYTVSGLLNDSEIRSVSLGIISKVNPHVLTSKVTDGNNSSFTAFGLFKIKNWSFYVNHGTASIITFFVYIVLTVVFASMILVFLGRIAGLWLTIIISPIAFVSWAIPSLADDKNIGFVPWLKNLVRLALTTPIFLFFIYITIQVLNIDLGENIESGFFVADVLKMIIPVFMATYILMKGQQIATETSEQVGKLTAKWSGQLSNLAVGTSVGSTAFIGRQTVGRGGAAIANNEALLKAQAKGGLTGWGAGMLRSAGKSTSAASFDVRNSDSIMKRFGQATDAMGNKIDMGDKFKQTWKDGEASGFTKEGRPDELLRNFKQQIADNTTKSRTEAMEELKLNNQAKAAAAIREKELEKQHAEEILQHEKSKQDNALVGFRTDSAFALEQQKIVEDERATMRNRSTELYDEIQTRNQEVQQLAQIMANKNPNQITDAERKNYEDKAKQLEDKKEEQRLVLKALGSIDAHTQTTTQVMADMVLKGYTSIAQMERDKAAFEAQAKNSSENIELEKAKTAAAEKQTKIDELQKQQKAAQKVGNAIEVRRLGNEIAREKNDLTGPGGLQEKLDLAKAAYNTKYGDKIKTLTKDLKQYQKDLSGTDLNQTKIQLLSHDVSVKNRNLAESSFDRDQTNKEIQYTYANRLEQDGRSTSGMRAAIGVITGGAVGGENINNAGLRSATAVRNNFGRQQ